MKYQVSLYQSEEGFSASVLTLHGCWSEGQTKEEALNNIQDAIQEYLSALQERLQGINIKAFRKFL